MQLNYIGKKIQQSCKDLAIKTLQLPTDEMTIGPIRHCECQQYIQENLYYFFGEYLCTNDENIKDKLISFANIYGENAVNTLTPINQSIHFVYSSRFILLEFLENEVKKNNLSVDTLFKVLKILDPLYQLISNKIMSHHNEYISSTRYALDESNKDLKTSLKELSDLKNALNQATIFSISDRNDNIVYVNDNFCTLYKYTKEELIGQNHFLLFSHCHPKEYFDEILKTIQRGEVWTGEILNKAKDGSIYCVDTTMVPFIDQNGETYQHISIQYDITEKKKTEEILNKTEKLSMVGQLAAGIAHEIRNPLTSIKGFVQLLAESEKGKYYSDIILDEIERINLIVSEFMVFAKPYTTYFGKCNMIDIVNSVIHFLGSEALLKNVNIKTHFPTNEIWVLGERNQLKQVILNILKNGIEAMPNGGNIDVKVESAFQEVLIYIEDNGNGMSEEQVKKIGEPFYTTKESGNGLGLMVSYKIIQDHKGTIKVTSLVNKGTSFVISLPRIELNE